MDIFNSLFDFINNENTLLIPIVSNDEYDKSIIFDNLRKYSNNDDYIFINLPSTHTLLDLSEEKLITRDFLCFAKTSCVIVVSNETSLDINLNLLFQVMELSENIIFCINIFNKTFPTVIDKNLLESELGVPVILNFIENDNNLINLFQSLDIIISNKYSYSSNFLRYECNIENVICSFDSELQQSIKNINPRWLALRIIDNDESFFKSMSIYLDESCVTKLQTIKKEFPKTCDPLRVRSCFNKKNLDYSTLLKNKVCQTKTDNINNNSSYCNIKLHFKQFEAIVIIIMMIALLCSFIFLP